MSSVVSLSMATEVLSHTKAAEPKDSEKQKTLEAAKANTGNSGTKKHFKDWPNEIGVLLSGT